MEAVAGEHLPATPSTFTEFRQLMEEIAPAVLDAVAAFAYGFSVISEALERHERLGPAPSPSREEDVE